MHYIRTFQSLGKTDVLVAGGKGANLGELVAAGLPVPPGFVLTTDAYDSFVQAHGLQQQIVDLAGTASADDPQSCEAASQRIRALFNQGVIDGALAAEITNAYGQLTQTNGQAVAVRSSATAEDLPEASFAGQQDTYLNIRGEDALLDAVKKCWASLWTARAMAYRQRQGIDPANVSLAVVVQHMVDADAAGILFTANPVTGERGQVVINAAWGLGEAIVSGQVTPDTVIVDKASRAILSRETAAKTTMTVRTKTGTEERPVPEARQSQPVLDDATAQELARYGAAIEAHYSQAMDVEWAIAGDEIFILQARPITSLPTPRPAPLQDVAWEPPTPNTVWMRRQIVEHMPEPLSPLFEDLYLRQGLGVSIEKLMKAMEEVAGTDLDFMSMVPHGFADTINGYAYTTGSFRMTGRNLWAVLRIYARIFRFFKVKAFDWEGTVLPGYQATIARWQALDLTQAEDETLLEGVREMATADSSYWFGSAANLGLSRIMDPVFDWLLRSFLFRGALPTPQLGSTAFLRGFNSQAIDAQADMEALAGQIRESDSLRELVQRTPVERLLDALAAHPDGQPVLDGIESYLDKYGHQIYNLDFVDPTQNENPLPFLLSLKALVKDPPEQDVRTRQARMAKERDELVEQTMQALNPLSRRLFRWVWKWTKHYAPYREHVMFYMGAAWPTLRRLAHELGRRLTEAGTLADPDDIYYLNSDEIIAAIAARARGESMPDLIRVAQERRTLREARKQLTPPPKVPERSSLRFGPISLSMFDPTPSDAVNDGAVLDGHAVSSGRVTAPASVIRSVDEFDRMRPGTILVCTTTTPAWTPLFSQAVGLVTDVGGALAHGSIVAREYGIPAVMGTAVATERIQSGQMIHVDGDRGRVILVDGLDGTGDASNVAAALPESGQSSRTASVVAFAAGIAGLLIWRNRRNARK